MVFPKLCHSCGGCNLVCPENAIEEKPRSIGEVFTRNVEELELVYGKLNVGEALAVPIISAVKEKANPDGLVVIDSPPGSACPVVESALGADFCLMVTEPTPFGIHDLKRDIELLDHFEVSPYVVINKYDINLENTFAINEYCRINSIANLGCVPYDREVSNSIVAGKPIVYYKSDSPAAKAINKIWREILYLLYS